eukprot:CAMPEP_0178378526 /NCGR_PEP_ID=MMETSP0689_2-20121128/4474_1 /TAXON_ID=160604 /ORGANISM="Amphidinium massartii, Strain CS-259" /LENGTH=350 /DNA_ID=CAMNT_0019998603 /DNA_START=243 /DNA_END=1295 /DNA_ORIENTATION=-
MNCYGDKSRDFLAKTPRGLLPALELDGKFYTESSKIMQLIEDAFPDRMPLMPPSRQERARADELLGLERDVFGAWLYWLRGQESMQARKSFEHAMDLVDTALAHSGGAYFLGKDVSLVDLIFVSTLERIAASILYYKGLLVRGNSRWGHVSSWFDAMETRDTYIGTRSDYHTHVHDLPPQIGGCISSNSPEQKKAAAAIDGLDGSWNLPLPPLRDNKWEPFCGEENDALDRLEAANALCKCHGGVLRSSHGSQAADLAFRHVAMALVDGMASLQIPSLGEIDASAAKSLRWTRDRISVPRDMSFPAARQLRAHLNAVADVIDPQGRFPGVPIPVHDRRDVDPASFAVAGA